ncbi:max dimerization protein 1 isoform X1 [Xenopus laevis]|uniref:Max dimerization protein 1 isoform X1 n=1 Tax=Xenopus laevis TaxID=8355 RepID=A0A8J0UW30_XENLA|nr:max dimerization protein 1 isoform X1 [Xenopus laevis]
MAAPVCVNIQMLLEAAEYLERREREAEHGYASMLPYNSKERDGLKRKSKSKKSSSSRVTIKEGREGNKVIGPMAPSDTKVQFGNCKGRKAGWSTHNEMEKNRRAHLRLCLEKLKMLVPVGPEANRHTTLSLLTRAKLHIMKLEDCDKRSQHQIDQLQREQRHLKRQLEKFGVERTRVDSIGSAMSSERSDSDREEIDVDVESTDYLTADLDWSSSSSSVSDLDERGSMQSICSDEGYSSSSLKRIELQDNPKSIVL